MDTIVLPEELLLMFAEAWQESAAEKAFEGELDRIRERIGAESDEVIQAALEEGLRAHEEKRPATKVGRQAEAATAFVAAGARLGLSAGTSKVKAAEQKRTPRAQVKDAAKAISNFVSGPVAAPIG